jgi:dihydropteroate synthase
VDLLAPLDRPRVMGVVNVTPDSFSDAGRFATVERAVAHGRALVAQGADLVDVGGESTRPGATRPLVADELARVVPVIEELAGEGVVVSVDTMRAEVARAALESGASVVNDVSGGLADPEVLDVVAAAGVPYVAMHWRAHADRMAHHTEYAGGVVAGVREELAARLTAIEDAGVDPGRVVLDPGLGFAKTQGQNWELLQGLDELESLGRPVLVGASRKSFLGSLLAEDGRPRPVDQREAAHLALVVLLAQRGTWGVRVHDVRVVCDALALLERMRGSADGS